MFVIFDMLIGFMLYIMVVLLFIVMTTLVVKFTIDVIYDIQERKKRHDAEVRDYDSKYY